MKKEGELIILNGLEGNARADAMTTSQEFLLPFVPTIEIFYTILYFGTIIFLITRFIAIPLLSRTNS